MKQEESDDSSHVSGKTISHENLASTCGGAAAIADPECGSSAPLEGKLINSTTSACVLINFISVGYILNPSGKRKEMESRREGLRVCRRF